MFFAGKDSLSRERKGELAAFQKTADLRFRSIELLNLALTHRSCGNEDPLHAQNNERLEFLGDAVLGLVTASCLYSQLADRSEGELARVKSYVVSEEVLSEQARALGIDRCILLGKGEEQSGGRNKRAILADALEAVIGACYLDAGFDTASRFVLTLVEPEVRKVLQNRHRKDYKTILQEYVQKYRRSYPQYSLVRRTGPDHDRTFWVNCSVGDKAYGPVSGKNKKEAEQNAAKAAYDAIVEAGGLEAARLTQIEG
ncbi:MAG TPA: ribonuclease III [Rectinemataceae bacterium]|nr:ribonuclease III [Rectinemataceae bacterium]